MTNKRLRFFHILLALFPLIFVSRASAESPKIFWASDPVRPNETVVLHGSDLGGASAVVEMARFADANTTAPGASQKLTEWTRVEVLQASAETLKFPVPAHWKMGVFACRVTANGAASKMVVFNAPDPWWIQGDEGEAATPGGWLRIQGKCLSLEQERDVSLLLVSEKETLVNVILNWADNYCLTADLPANLKVGTYKAYVHNSAGGDSAWRLAGSVQIIPAPQTPKGVFNVLEAYGPEAGKEMRKSLVKYNQPVDRTEGILAALKKAKEAGGGTVYFPAGRYMMKGPIVAPDHTLIKGEGMGLVTLWWGTGHFNLDGGGPQGRAKVEEPPPPHTLITGSDYSIEEMSLYLPLEYEQGIVAEKRFRMHHVKTRIDHYWLVQGRGKGTVIKPGRNFQITDCDILAKGEGIVAGEYGVIARNRVLSNKCNTALGGSQAIIVEDNHFVSMDPTAYQNISGVGRNIFYSHNHHEALYGHQSDFSFTFDAGGGAYIGGVAETKGTQVTLAADPTFPKWANEKSNLWKHCALFILDGRGAGQWRDVTAHTGRAWDIDRPFDTPPDATSVASIVPFNGKVLIIGNQFEDGNWVNAGYGTSIDVICAENHLARCADLMNYGLRYQGFFEPSWHVQYFDNVVAEGQTHIGSSGDGHKEEAYKGPLTRWSIHRRQTLAEDNGGQISITGNLLDALIEGCTLKNPLNTIKVDKASNGVVIRNNTFVGSDRPWYEGDGLKNAVITPKEKKQGG